MAQTDVVIVAQLAEAVRRARAEGVVGVVGKNRPLERVEEADAEVVRVARRHLRVGAGNADGGDPRVGEITRTGDGNRRTVGAEHDGNAGADQLLSRGRRLVGRRAVVGVNQLDFIRLAVDHDRRRLVKAELRPERLLFAARAAVAGRRLENADTDDLIRRQGR